MSYMDRSYLWHFDHVRELSRSVTLVRNRVTGEYMIYHVSPEENYPVMQTIMGINNANLMRVYDTALSGGVCVSLCEYIDAVTLEDAVNRRGTYDEKTAKKIMIQVCAGLTALHERGIIHRDINPSNVMITRNGTVKIIDYDITRSERPGASKDTQILGTLGYASPEQFGFAQTGARADVYSCGVLLNFLLTGKLPDEQIYQGRLRPVIERCTQIDMDKRYAGADQLARAIRSGKYGKGGVEPKRRILFKTVSLILLPVYLLLAGVYIHGMIFDPTKTSDPVKLKNNVIFEALLLLFWTLLPYIFFGDAFSLSRRLRPNDHAGGRAITVFFGIVSVIVGFFLLGFWTNAKA